jgi:hypothetical protein
MKLLFWISGVLLALTAVPAAFFFSLHISTGEHEPLVRAKALYRWSVVIVLGTFNYWIFSRVFKAIWALW